MSSGDNYAVFPEERKGTPSSSAATRAASRPASSASRVLPMPGGPVSTTSPPSPSRAEAMAREAGFSRFRPLDVDHPVNAFYEIRP